MFVDHPLLIVGFVCGLTSLGICSNYLINKSNSLIEEEKYIREQERLDREHIRDQERLDREYIIDQKRLDREQERLDREHIRDKEIISLKIKLIEVEKS